MNRTLVAFSAFVGAIALSIVAFATLGHAPLISTIESPDKTYVLHLSGKKSRPIVPILEHSIYFDLHRHGEQVVRGQKLHSGDWFDPAFENLYGDFTWVNSSILVFHRKTLQEGSRDTLNVTNNSSKPIKFLQVRSGDLFLLFDVKPQTGATVSAIPQTWLSGIIVEGEFVDGKRIPKKVVEFLIDPSMKGPFTYESLLTTMVQPFRVFSYWRIGPNGAWLFLHAQRRVCCSS